MSDRAALQPRAARLCRLPRGQRREQAGLERRCLRLCAGTTRSWSCSVRSPSPLCSGAAASPVCTTCTLRLGVRATGLFGTVTLGVLIAFIQYAQRFFRPIQDLSEKYNILQAAMAASERVFKLIDEEPSIVSPPQPEDRAITPGQSSSATSGSPTRRSQPNNRSPSNPLRTKLQIRCSVGFTHRRSAGRRRVDSARRLLHHRSRRDRSDRRSYRSGQNHHHGSDDALLRSFSTDRFWLTVWTFATRT